jgi:hypothetical protein
MPSLSSIAVLCLFNNKSNAFRVLSSGYKGFGLPNISLDWNAISFSGPLYQPWWAALNYYIGIAGAMYVVMPLIYFGNMWNATKFPSPINAGLYQNNTYETFNIAALLKADHTLDRDLFDKEKPVLLTPWCELQNKRGKLLFVHTLITPFASLSLSPSRHQLRNRLCNTDQHD